MVIFPEVAKTAQEELDRVCGERMPDLNDAINLPYVRACVKESLRWMPGFMLGIPHSLTKDDTYMHYHIPRGSTRHPNPRSFDPMRYMEDHPTDIGVANNGNKRDHFAFGAGRRRCQGIHIADRSMFLAISRMLWAFDIHRAVDPESKREIVPDMSELVSGMMAFPKAFPTKIRPRHASRADSVRREWEQMLALLDDQGQWKEVPKGLVWGDEQLFD
ncbi:hypothetical protein SLS62_000887 [Diatrype stigma]|uniref:Cytochrome P450 n=1 Tax=Diatrype stigma TaxID=117547 RepID=A0AAN9V0G1_9PEZI